MESAELLSDHHDTDQPFPFFTLPFELRREILFSVLASYRTIDLDPCNNVDAVERLSVFLTSRRMHEEAYHVFYGRHTFRILPIHHVFFARKAPPLPLLARLPSRYRRALITLELRLGPGWNNLPKWWHIDDRLGLEDMTAVRKLKVFLEIDPTHDVFKGFFRHKKDLYTDCIGGMLMGIIERLPTLEEIEFDGYPSVRDGLLIRRLVDEAKIAKKRIVWGLEIGLRSGSATPWDLQSNSCAHEE